MRAVLFSVFLVSALGSSAQGPVSKGQWFLYWGYNRAGYSWSDIHLNGADYDITLRHVKAYDRPENLSLDYGKPSTMWIPQYNYRVGYFLRDRWSISLGLDHMKYVVAQWQTVRMDGYVDAQRSDEYALDYSSRDVELRPDLLKYEHTDGLNLLSIDLDHYSAIWSSRNERFRLVGFGGMHVGPVIPRSDVRVFGTGINNNFHLSGFGVGAQAGFHLTLWEHLLVRFTGRTGWIELPDVLTTGESSDRASQHFWFWQANLAVGAQFALGKGTKAESPRP